MARVPHNNKSREFWGLITTHKKFSQNFIASSQYFFFLHFSYCLTNEDASKDTKWTKIQQRCLISERAGHCSNVSTPRAERDQRQSRRLREVQLQNSKKQQKKRESEEQGKRKSTDSSKGEEREKTKTEDKENGAEDGENLRRREKASEGVLLNSQRSLNFPRSDVRLVKSPTVKITRLPSSVSRKRQRVSGSFAKPAPPPASKNVNKVANLQTKPSNNSSRGPLVQQTAANVTNQNQTIEGGIVMSPVKGKSRTSTETFRDGIQENDADMEQEVGGDSFIAMECSASVLSPSTPPPCTGSSEGLLTGAAGSTSTSAISSPVLRRSPRLKKRLSNAKNLKEGGSSRRDGGSSDAKRKRRSDTDKRKEKSLKAVSLFDIHQ